LVAVGLGHLLYIMWAKRYLIQAVRLSVKAAASKCSAESYKLKAPS
jgi:hypothetical protein